MSLADENLLLVEGTKDLFAIQALMQAHVPWSKDRKQWPARLEDMKGVEELLKAGAISARLKTPGLSILGVILDADKSAASRYQKVRHRCAELFPNLPETMPPEGLITDNGEKCFGLWIMPDNVADGDLETFLKFLVPGENAPLWKLATESVDRAIATGAACKGHETKAGLYTWLAWQKDPGQSPGLALTAKVLDPTSSSATPFVTWFKSLYQLQ